MENKKKVLIVSPLYPYPEYKDGASKIIANLLIENESYTSSLVCIVQESDDLNGDFEFDRLDYGKVSKLGVTRNWLFTSNPITTSRYINCFASMTSYLKDNHSKYDVIHLATTFLLPILNDLSAEVKNKIILFPIDSLHLYNGRRLEKTNFGFKKLAYYFEYLKVKRFEKKYYRMVKTSCFVSKIDSNHNDGLLEYKRSRVIPNGVDVEFFTADETVAKEKSLIFTGNVDYAPNKDAVDVFVNKIFPEFLKQHPSYKLYIVGVASKETIDEFSSENVVVTGFVDDLRDYMNKAVVYVSPLRFGSGIKNKVLEAMSMNMPIVGTPVSYDGIDVDFNSVVEVSEPDDVSEWLQVLNSIIGDSQKRNTLGENARKVIEMKYSWKGVRSQYGEVYADSINNR